MKFDIKTIIAILTIVSVLSGFYYTTELRLVQLESHAESINDKIKNIELETKDLSKSVKRLMRKKGKNK
jgi:cell division protein FtsL